MKFMKLVAGAALALLAGQAQAATVVTDIPVGSVDPSFNNFDAANTQFLGLMNALHTINLVASFDSASAFNGADAVWVNAHHNVSGVFSATEASNVAAFIAAGAKGVIITDNDGWSNFNAQIETIIGATITDICDTSIGTASATNRLGAGVGTVDHQCGSILDPAANGEVIVSEGIAGLYTVGLGEVLVITSVDLFRGASMVEPEFAANIAAWLDEPLNTVQQPADVPAPAAAPLLLAALGGFAALRRRR